MADGRLTSCGRPRTPRPGRAGRRTRWPRRGSRPRSWCRRARRGWPRSSGVITSRSAICRLDSPRARRASTSTSREVSPFGHARRMLLRRPAAVRTARDRVPVEASGADVGGQRGGDLVRGERLAIRARLGHRVVDVRGGEQSVHGLQRRSGEPTGVARPVEALLVPSGHPAAGGEGVDIGEHPLGEIGLEADVLQFSGAQRATLVPDAVGHAQSSEPVQEAGSANRQDVGLGQPPQAGRRGGESGHTPGVSGELWGLEVRQVGHRLQHVVEVRTAHPPRQARFGVDDRRPPRCLVQTVEDVGLVPAEEVDDGRVEVGTAVAHARPPECAAGRAGGCRPRRVPRAGRRRAGSVISVPRSPCGTPLPSHCS